MMKSRKPWASKLKPEQKPGIVMNPKTGAKMLIPTPMLVAEVLNTIQRGRLTTGPRIREVLAKRFGAEETCPLTTGIFLNIVAGAAEDDAAAGRKPLAPWWRVVLENGTLNKKFPPGMARQLELLKAEGFPTGVHGRAKTPCVEHVENYL